MSKAEQAVECFNGGFNCAQAVFSTYCEQLGLNKEQALKISGAFGGGMGRMGETCGAVTGAFMLIGLKYGQIKADDVEARERTYEFVKKFADRFREVNGSLGCKELLGLDISDPEMIKLAREKNLFRTLCPKYVKDAAEIVEEILEL